MSRATQKLGLNYIKLSFLILDPGVEGIPNGDLLDRELHQRERAALDEKPPVRQMDLLPQQPQAEKIQ